jgi:hypothetical protein
VEVGFCKKFANPAQHPEMEVELYDYIIDSLAKGVYISLSPTGIFLKYHYGLLRRKLKKSWTFDI